MGWLIALAALLSLGFLPLGFCAIYRKSDPGVWLLIGPLKIRVYPGKSEEEKSKSQKASKKSKKEGSQKGGSVRDFQPVVRTILEFLDQFRRKIRVRYLEFKLVLAGDDPSDLAVNYGRAWAAVGSIMPQIERLFVIKKRNIEVECDFLAEQTMVFARLDATITVFRTLHLLSRHGIKTIKQLLELKNLRKGGAQL